MEIIVTFHNTHSVITAEKVLLAADLPVAVTEIPTLISAGCGLCLRISKEHFNKGLSVLAVHGIAIQEAYIQSTSECHKIEPTGSNNYENRITGDF